MPDTPRAQVRVLDGQVVLDDPDALTVVRALARHQCEVTARAQAKRIAHFRDRVIARGLTGADAVIVISCVDDRHGGALAEVLMPGHDWTAIRARGEIPYARGLAARDGIQGCLRLFDEEAADRLAALEGLAVVVVDYGVAAVYSADEVPS